MTGLGALRFELTDPVTLQRFLVANLAVSGVGESHWSAFFTRACRWYAHVSGRGLERAPFFVVHDLGVLLLKGDLFRFRALEARDSTASEDRAQHWQAQVAYHNRVLNRVARTPGFDALCEALVAAGRQDEVIAWLLERLLEPLRQAALPQVLAPAPLLRQGALPGALSPQTAVADLEAGDGRAGLALLAEMCAEVAATYDEVAASPLFGAEDCYVVRHFDVLGSRQQRLAAQQLAELEAALGPLPPLPARWRLENPQVAVELPDAGYFPQGGLDALATHGSLENLVRSELVYIDPARHPDLFTLRFLEGELLYYTRDEGQLMRRARLVHLWLDLRPEHTVRYPGHPARLSILLQATVQRCVDDLFESFAGDAVRVVLHACGWKREEVARGWRVRFSQELEAGRVALETSDLPDWTQTPLPWAAAGSQVSAIYVGASPPPAESRRQALCRAGVSLYWFQVGPLPRRFIERPEDWRFALDTATSDIVEDCGRARTSLVWAAVAG